MSQKDGRKALHYILFKVNFIGFWSFTQWSCIVLPRISRWSPTVRVREVPVNSLQMWSTESLSGWKLIRFHQTSRYDDEPSCTNTQSQFVFQFPLPTLICQPHVVICWLLLICLMCESNPKWSLDVTCFVPSRLQGTRPFQHWQAPYWISVNTLKLSSALKHPRCSAHQWWNVNGFHCTNPCHGILHLALSSMNGMLSGVSWDWMGCQRQV